MAGLTETPVIFFASFLVWVIFGVACVCLALFCYPGGRYQGHGAGMLGAFVAVLVLGYIVL